MRPTPSRRSASQEGRNRPTILAELVGCRQDGHTNTNKRPRLGPHAQASAHQRQASTVKERKAQAKTLQDLASQERSRTPGPKQRQVGSLVGNRILAGVGLDQGGNVAVGLAIDGAPNCATRPKNLKNRPFELPGHRPLVFTDDSSNLEDRLKRDVSIVGPMLAFDSRTKFFIEFSNNERRGRDNHLDIPLAEGGGAKPEAKDRQSGRWKGWEGTRWARKPNQIVSTE